MCLDYINFKSLTSEIYGLKLERFAIQNMIVESFDFIKILAQIINNFSKFQQNEK